MQRILESIVIALESIRANKLRSFMTVLGNIVAVTSIVTVVSLIQGMNAMVSRIIVTDVGTDSFTIQRRPPVRTADDEEQTRNNPLVTLGEADAIRRFSPTIASVVAQAQRRGTITYRDQVLENVQIQGVTSDYVDFATFDAERGRMMSSSEVERNHPVVLLGWDVAEQLFGEVNPLDGIIKVQGVHFRVVGVSERKGGVFGASMDGFAVIPLGRHMKLFGARQSLSLMVKPASPALLPLAMDDATVALRVARRLRPREADNFGIFTSDTLLGIYRQATAGIFAVLVGVVAGWGVLVLNGYKPPRPLVRQAGALQRHQEVRIGGWRVEHLPSINFYCQRDVAHYDTEAQVASFLQSPGRVYLFARARDWEAFADKAGVRYRVLARHRDIYKNCDVVVVTNQPSY